MGGSGNGFFERKSPAELAESIRKLESRAQGEEFEANVGNLLGQALAGANDRNDEAVQVHLREIVAALERDIDGTVDLLFGGSVAKQTFVEGLSDVDALVILNRSDLTSLTPEEVCEYLRKRLSERFPKTNIQRDGFAIDIPFQDVTVQLVPAIRKGDMYLLPDSGCKEWTVTRPKAFTDLLTALNRKCSGKLIPVIKLAKSILSVIPESRRISGYHAELMSTQIFERYQGAFTLKAMLHHFFEAAPSLIRRPIGDPTGQSAYVDPHLGPADSVERLMTADSLDRIGRRMRNADGAKSVDQWRALLE